MLAPRLLAAVVAALALSPAARAGEGLRQPLTAVLSKLAPGLKDKKITDVNLVQPDGPTPPLANAKPGDVRKVAAEVIAAAGFKVNAESPAKVVIDFTKTKTGAGGVLAAVDLDVSVTDPETGDVFARDVYKISDRFTLDRLGGTLPSPIDVPLNQFAAGIAAEVDKLGKSELTLQSVQGPDGENKGVFLMVQEALARQTTAKGKLKVTIGADLRLRVVYQIKGDKADAAAYVFAYELLDAQGQEVKTEKSKPMPMTTPEVNQDQGGIKTLAKAAPVPGAIPPSESDEERLQKYLDRLAKRTQAGVTVTAEGEVRADSAGAKFGLEIWVGGKPLMPKLVGGHAVVELAEGDEYQVVIRNRSGAEAAADVSIDGLSMFAFRKVPGENLVSLGKAGGLIHGWYKTNTDYAAFKVGTSGDGPAAKMLGKNADTGSITVTVRAAWDPKEGPPADEPRAKARGARSGVMGTLVGPDGKSDLATVTRDHGEIREVIVVRYAPKK